MSEDLDAAFIERQRQRLEALWERNMNVVARARDDDRAVSEQYASDVQDSGDEGAGEAHRGIDDALSADGERRLSGIRRALEKIQEGTYGLSDESGEPIPQARLEAVPEARFTVEEEELYERR